MADRGPEGGLAKEQRAQRVSVLRFRLDTDFTVISRRSMAGTTCNTGRAAAVSDATTERSAPANGAAK